MTLVWAAILKFGLMFLTELWKLLVAMWKTRLGVGVIVGSICLLIGYYNGKHTVQKKWDAARANAVVEVKKIDDRVEAKVSKADHDATLAELRQSHQNVEKLHAYIADLKGVGCTISGPALDRMLDVGGGRSRSP